MELTRGTRWLAFALPVVVVTGVALGRAAPPNVAAAAPPGSACASRTSPPASGRDAPAWYRLDEALDGGGTLAGRQLTVGRGAARWRVLLPPESFASGPVDGRVLVGDDDGVRSRLRVLDTAAACWTTLADEPAVIRSAVLTADGRSLLEHRVDRQSREDLGVWRREVTGRHRGPARRVLPGLGANAGIGPIFATTLLVAPDGRLIAASCGERACQTRVLDPETGTVTLVDHVGPPVGLTGGTLVTLEACDGLPCPLDAVDLATGARTIVDEAVGPASVTSGADGFVVLAEPSGIGVSKARPGGADRAVPGTLGLAPVTVTSVADSGIEVAPGRVALAPGGRVQDAASTRYLDPAALRLAPVEVTP